MTNHACDTLAQAAWEHENERRRIAWENYCVDRILEGRYLPQTMQHGVDPEIDRLLDEEGDAHEAKMRRVWRRLDEEKT